MGVHGGNRAPPPDFRRNRNKISPSWSSTFPFFQIFGPSYGPVTSLWFILYRRDDKAKYTVLEAQNKRLGTLILSKYLAREGES